VFSCMTNDLERSLAGIDVIGRAHNRERKAPAVAVYK